MAKSSAPADAPATAEKGRAELDPAPAATTSMADDTTAGPGTLGPDPLPAPSASTNQLPYLSWDRYRIEGFLGAGGMGAVYKARDCRLNRSVAIKFLRGGQADSFGTRQRRQFEREARAQASIEHPHICKIYDVGEVEGQPYIAMQLIQGTSLAGQQAMARDDKVRALQKVAEALHAAHLQGLIHRDIKPAEVGWRAARRQGQPVDSLRADRPAAARTATRTRKGFLAAG
jgi:serine/threonine-protein kinase